jgi:DNA-binding MarR family transcriptional regulator
VKGLIASLNRAFDNRVRLGVMAVLMTREAVDFNELKTLLEATDGNLASHISKLEKEGFVLVKKQFLDKKPNTKYSVTAKGRQAFNKHISALEALISNQNQ